MGVIILIIISIIVVLAGLTILIAKYGESKDTDSIISKARKIGEDWEKPGC